MLNRQVKILVWPDLETVNSGDFVSASDVAQNKAQQEKDKSPRKILSSPSLICFQAV